MLTKMMCRQCGQPIVGQYVTALGANWHPEHFVCAGCGRPFGNGGFQVHEGKPYHTECYRDLVGPRCAYCNKPLVGQYLVHEGRSYHDECYREHVAPRCGYCGKPLLEQYHLYGGKPYHDECYREHIAPRCNYCDKPLLDRYHLYGGKPYHDECYRDHVAPRCVYCNKPLVGEYLEDHWGAKFCKEHEAEYPRCPFCSRLVPPPQQERGIRAGEDVRCPVCRGTAVESQTQAQSMLVRLRRWMGDQGLTYGMTEGNIPLTVELCSRARLATLLKDRTDTHTLGVTMSTTLRQNGQEVRTDITGIGVLYGMPVELFQGVAVHELCHAWLIANGIKNLPAWTEEGFCELLSYRFYTESRTPESQYHAGNLEKNPDLVYGEGFRRVQARANALGFQRFVELLKTTKKMP